MCNFFKRNKKKKKIGRRTYFQNSRRSDSKIPATRACGTISTQTFDFFHTVSMRAKILAMHLSHALKSDNLSLTVMNDELTNANERVDEGLKRNRPAKEPFRNLWSPIFPFFFPFFPPLPLFSFSDSGTDDSKIYIYIYVCMRVNIIYLSYACVHARIVTGMNRSGWRGECRPIRKGVVLNHASRSIPHFHSANDSRRVVIFKKRKRKKKRVASRSNVLHRFSN